MNRRLRTDRRRFLGQVAFGAAAVSTPGLFAELLERTPRSTEGPFYPDRLPLDTDNDLLIVNDALSPAVGTITHLGGRILDVKGNPIHNAVVEIWQCDNQGAYLHSGTSNRDRRDANFQGFGRFLTGRKGEYYFRTIRPVPYPGRTPHIHVIVKKGEHRLLTTQLYVQQEKQRNERDFLYGRLDEDERKLVTIDFKKLEDSEIGELVAEANIVVGLTPEDPEEDRRGGGPRRPRDGAPPRERSRNTRAF